MGDYINIYTPRAPHQPGGISGSAAELKRLAKALIELANAQNAKDCAILGETSIATFDSEGEGYDVLIRCVPSPSASAPYLENAAQRRSDAWEWLS
ncbi:MAG: hypothetical protein HC910_22840 [Spirulinaceae cyanobacterium SM2_1_0]|nr:hypothetical protein [Spirulinaceae cyanobacterium SM2_1_0]